MKRLLSFTDIGCVDSRQRGNSSLAPEEILHLAAIGKLESEFIYKMIHSRRLCACHKRLNNNSFHVRHTGFPSANSARSLLVYQIDGCCRGNDTEHLCTVFDQTAARKLQQCCHVRALSLTACSDYYTGRYIEKDNDRGLVEFGETYRFIKIHLDFIKKIALKKNSKRVFKG